ncbi:MAG: TldD/PmbA family protein [Bacilli bacterium]|nr:TldD/PmbA family protein [Bacilli bacterium]
MLSKSLAIQVLNKLLETGADYSEIFLEYSESHSLTIDNGKVDASNNAITSGVGLRILKNNQTVYGFTSDITKKGLMSLAESLNKSFNDKQSLTVTNLEKIKCKNRNVIKRSYNDVPLQEKIDLLKEGIRAIETNKDPRIVRHIAMFGNNSRHVEVFNSKGKHFSRDTEFARMIFQVVAANEKGMEIGFEGPGCQSDISYFHTVVNPVDTAKKAVRTALLMLDAKECPSGKMPVVIGNGWGGVLFHEACGHPLEASAVSRNLSYASGKEGELIASPIVTAIDDSTIPNEWGSIDIDDEGNLGEKRVLIKDGKLVNFMIDDFNGRRMKRNGNGSCRRQNYKYCPTSRMSNTYIANGKSTPEEIIKSTKLGLYTVGFNGGSVDPTTGEFNFGCSEAYIIRDGKIAEPVKGATLIGKGEEILKKIDMIANDLAFGQGMCGAASGSIRTNVGQPTLRISEILVGGRGGELK